MVKYPRKKRQNNRLGRMVREGRERVGITQKGLADALGIEYYTMISQMELGYMAIPSSLWVPLGEKLDMNVADWVLLCLNEYYPEVYRALFGVHGRAEVVEVLNQLKAG